MHLAAVLILELCFVFVFIILFKLINFSLFFCVDLDAVHPLDVIMDAWNMTNSEGILKYNRIVCFSGVQSGCMHFYGAFNSVFNLLICCI